jgi:hypothetical protein
VIFGTEPAGVNFVRNVRLRRNPHSSSRLARQKNFKPRHFVRVLPFANLHDSILMDFVAVSVDLLLSDKNTTS